MGGLKYGKEPRWWIAAESESCCVCHVRQGFGSSWLLTAVTVTVRYLPTTQSKSRHRKHIAYHYRYTPQYMRTNAAAACADACV